MPRSRKDLDKDMMFKKIMPALGENPFTADKIGSMADNKNKSDTLQNFFVTDKEIGPSDGASQINIMESVVWKYVDEVIGRFNSCKCDRCRSDIVAYALNNLPPKYVVAVPSVIKKKEKEISVNQVMNALVKAVIAVRSRPRH